MKNKKCWVLVIFTMRVARVKNLILHCTYWQTDTDNLAGCRTITPRQQGLHTTSQLGRTLESHNFPSENAASCENEDGCVVKGFPKPGDYFWPIDRVGDSCLSVWTESCSIQQWRSCDGLLLLFHNYCPQKLWAPSSSAPQYLPWLLCFIDLRDITGYVIKT